MVTFNYLLSLTVISIWMISSLHETSCLPTDRTVIQDLQRNILDIFGHKNRPRPDVFATIGRDTTSAKKYMIGLYNYANEMEEASVRDVAELNGNNVTNQVIEDADTVVSFVNHALIPRPNASDEEGAMFFDVQSNLVIENTLASELRIYLDVTEKAVADNVFKVTVYQIIIPKVRYLVLTSRIINATASQWHEFDVINASNAWRESPVNNNGILIVCETLTNRVKTLKECGLIDFKSKNENRPFLVSFYQSGDEDEFLAEQLPDHDEDPKGLYHERVRRSLKDLFPRAPGSMPNAFNGNRDNSSCGKHPLYIGFKDLGWSDWIIAPEGYKAAYCDGECNFPLHDKMNASNHAIIQTLVHMIDSRNIPQPCCAPVRLDSLKVLYLDERNNIIMKTYGNMIVNDCGCQ